MNNQENDTVSREKRFLFDLQGFLVLQNILSQAECAEYLEVLRYLEPKIYEDKWMKSVGVGRPTCETSRQHQIRLNGLPRLDSVFDQLICRSATTNQYLVNLQVSRSTSWRLAPRRSYH